MREVSQANLSTDRAALEEIEIELLLEGLARHYGFDFQDYASDPLRRVIRSNMRKERVKTVSGFQEKVFHNSKSLDRLVAALSVQTTDRPERPTFFLDFRREVVPLLRTYPFVRLWHAGCSSVVEIYCIAIILHEEGIYEKCQIYATDLSPNILQRAEDGLIPIASLPAYAGIYRDSGGIGSFADFYMTGRRHAIFHSSLKKNIVFAQHNLTTDSSFNEFNVILCRYLLSRFNQALQSRVHKTLYDSLQRFGILALGPTESLRHTAYENSYVKLNLSNHFYRKYR